MKKRIQRMLPVACIIGMTIIISLVLYNKVIEQEEDRCLQLLRDAAESVNKEVTMKFEDEIAKLHLVEMMMLEENKLEEEQIQSLHLETFQTTTIFSRIDIMYPTQNVIVENGRQRMVCEELSFEEAAAKGEHITSRKTDFETGKECVYYNLPVVKDGETLAILIGVIEADSLSEIFLPTIYEGKANCCLIDRSDGNFIMDSWHEELGNAYDMVNRERLEDYEDVDLKSEIKNRKSGVVAFVSKTVGIPLYMYYMPSDLFDWQLAIFIQEDVAFENLMYLKNLLLIAGIIEAVFLILYFIWNLYTLGQLENSKTEIEKQQEQLTYMSYRDMLTNLYNRNKYIQMFEVRQGQSLEKTGVAYIDLNGLKEINDQQSHGAGDIYIRQAAQIISDNFQNEAYRIGGDEFVVLAMDIKQEMFQYKIAALKDQMQRTQISVSIGYLWQENCENLEEMLRKAEEQMYKEKQLYYQNHNRRRH